MVPIHSVSLLLCFVMGAYGQYFYSTPNYYNPIQYQQPIYTFAQSFEPQYRQQYNELPTTNSEASRQNNHVESNFRGYAYHMENNDGARSNVIFLSGPELHKMKQNIVLKSRTSASDAVDSNAINMKYQEEIQRNPFESLIEYLRHPQMGVQNFYYINDVLVMRGVDQEIPLPKARSLETVVDSPLVPLLKSTFNLDITTEKIDDNTDVSQQGIKPIEPVVPTSTTTTTTERPENVMEESTTSVQESEETTKMEIIVEEETSTLDSTTIKA